jgi:hypothetical protein
MYSIYSWYNDCLLHNQQVSHCSVEITYEGEHEEQFNEFLREKRKKKYDMSYCQNYTWKSIREEDGGSNLI